MKNVETVAQMETFGCGEQPHSCTTGVGHRSQSAPVISVKLYSVTINQYRSSELQRRGRKMFPSEEPT